MIAAVLSFTLLAAGGVSGFLQSSPFMREHEFYMPTDVNVTGCSYSATCTAGGIEGVCVSISAGCCSGTTTSNLCPGSSDIKCCTNNYCSTPSGTGTCKQTSACSGTSVPGYCTGPSDLQCCVSGTSSGVYGVDVSASVSSSTFSCLKSSGFGTFAIPRGYQSTGKVDPNVCSNLNNAKSGGFGYRDVYLFPCPTCSASASSQMSSLVSYIKSNCASAWSGRVWLDVEGSQYWLGSTSSNQNWYKALVDSCSSAGTNCGVYSSSSQWSAIFGSTSFSYGSNLPLWYAHYDGKASFSDFSPFGGWSKPYAKQYNGDKTVCGVGIDENYAPSWSG